MTAYFRDGRDIASTEVLGDCADRAGVSRAVTTASLDVSTEQLNALQRAIEALSSAYAITGVPSVLFDAPEALMAATSVDGLLNAASNPDGMALSGAQDRTGYERILGRMASARGLT